MQTETCAQRAWLEILRIIRHVLNNLSPDNYLNQQKQNAGDALLACGEIVEGVTSTITFARDIEALYFTIDALSGRIVLNGGDGGSEAAASTTNLPCASRLYEKTLELVNDMISAGTIVLTGPTHLSWMVWNLIKLSNTNNSNDDPYDIRKIAERIAEIHFKRAQIISECLIDTLAFSTRVTEASEKARKLSNDAVRASRETPNPSVRDIVGLGVATSQTATAASQAIISANQLVCVINTTIEKLAFDIVVDTNPFADASMITAISTAIASTDEAAKACIRAVCLSSKFANLFVVVNHNSSLINN